MLQIKTHDKFLYKGTENKYLHNHQNNAVKYSARDSLEETKFVLFIQEQFLKVHMNI